MRKLFTTIILFCLLAPEIFAQSQTTEYNVDGIKVIFKPTVKEIVNVRFFYRGGVTNYPVTQAGIERFALSAATECGTQKYSGDSYRDLADKYSIAIRVAATYDYGDIEMECVSKYFNEGWDLLTEAVAKPVFDKDQVQLLKDKIVTSIRQGQSNPDTRSDQLILKNAFEGTAYAANPDGEEGVIKRLTETDLKNYYEGLLNKNQIFIVVAGKIDKEMLIAKIKASFANLPSKPYNPVNLQEPVWNDNKVFIENRELSTNYINGIMNAPQVNSEDYVPYRLGVAALGGSLFAELRTRLNLSYDPGTSSVMQKMPYGLMYISTTKPKEAVSIMTETLNKFMDYGISPNGLTHLKAGYFTGNYIKLQSTSAITQSLGVAEILGGWSMDEALPTAIDNVTVEQVNKALSKYIVGLRWSYLGNQQQADEAAKSFKKQVK
jgi:zinc protease